MRSPIDNLPANIKKACVLAVVPASGSLRDWSPTAAAVSVVDVPTWEQVNGVGAIKCSTTSAYIAVASGAAMQFSSGSVFVGGDIVFGNLYGRMVYTDPNHIQFVEQSLSQISLNTSWVAGFSWDGVRSVACTFSNGAQPLFYRNGVYHGLGFSAVTVTGASYSAALGNRPAGGTPSVQPFTSSLVFNRILTGAENGIVHAWSEALRTPSKAWPGMGAGMLSRPSQVTIDPPRSTVVEGAERLTDGDMEAVGTAAWTSYFSAVLEKRTDGPHSGTQYMRCTNGGGINATFYENGRTVVGTRYRFRVWYRSPTGALVVNGGGLTIFAAAPSVDWALIDFTYVAVSTSGFRLRVYTGALGDYADFDDVSCVETNERISDGDMEASGVGAWPAYGTATITKSTALPYSGTQALRITKGGVTDGARPVSLVSGAKYRFRGRARGDGTAYPVVQALTSFWTGTTSSAWQEFDFIATTTSAALQLIAQNGGVGNWVEFDAVSIVPVEECVGAWDLGMISNGRAPDLSGKGNVGTVTGNVQVVSTPVGKAARFDGSAARVEMTATQLRSATLSLFATITPSDVSGAKVIAASGSNASGPTNNFLFYVSNGALRISSGSVFGATSVVLTAGNTYRVGFVVANGTASIYVNGVRAVGPFALTMVTTDASGEFIGNGYVSTVGFNGTIQDVVAENTELSPEEVAADYYRQARLCTFDSFSDSWRVSLASEGGAVGQRISNTPFKCGDTTGRWKVVDDPTVEGGRALECVVGGRLYIDSDQAFGTFEWDFWHTGNGYYLPIATVPGERNTTGQTGVYFTPADHTGIACGHTVSAAYANDYTAAASAYTLNSWWRTRFARRFDGYSSWYLGRPGGALTLVTAASGANPYTYLTGVTASKLMAFTAVAGNRIANVRRYQGELLV